MKIVDFYSSIITVYCIGHKFLLETLLLCCLLKGRGFFIVEESLKISFHGQRLINRQLNRKWLFLLRIIIREKPEDQWSCKRSPISGPSISTKHTKPGQK